MGFLLLIPLQACPEVTRWLSQPCFWAEAEEWVPRQQVAAHPEGWGEREWVHLNKILRQQEEGKADKNARSSCGNVGNEVTLQLAVTYFEAYRL